MPVSVNGAKLGPVDLLNKLNEIAARNGIGRTDLVENRLVGMKSRGAYETPGGTLLTSKAHQELERLTVDREKPRISSRRYRIGTPNSSTTGSGSRRCVNRSTDSLQGGAAIRYRNRRPEIVEGHAERNQP